MAGPPLSSQVRYELHRQFPRQEDAQVAAELLVECGEPQYGVDRIRLDVLMASKGQIEHVRRLVAMAKLDPRDVIVEAEYVETDGQLVPRVIVSPGHSGT